MYKINIFVFHIFANRKMLSRLNVCKFHSSLGCDITSNTVPVFIKENHVVISDRIILYPITCFPINLVSYKYLRFLIWLPRLSYCRSCLKNDANDCVTWQKCAQETYNITLCVNWNLIRNSWDLVKTLIHSILSFPFQNWWQSILWGTVSLVPTKKMLV